MTRGQDKDCDDDGCSGASVVFLLLPILLLPGFNIVPIGLVGHQAIIPAGHHCSDSENSALSAGSRLSDRPHRANGANKYFRDAIVMIISVQIISHRARRRGFGLFVLALVGLERCNDATVV